MAENQLKNEAFNTENAEDIKNPTNNAIIYSTKEFEDKYTYEGDDLGFVYSKEGTTFRVWAPTAEEVYLNLYKSGNPWEDDLCRKLQMTKDVKGTFVVKVPGDIVGTYYTFTAVIDGLSVEACSLYFIYCKTLCCPKCKINIDLI